MKFTVVYVTSIAAPKQTTVMADDVRGVLEAVAEQFDDYDVSVMIMVVPE